MNPPRITIADVAREAGVSKATVSRFLNRRDELLTRDIAERVEATIARLGYTPSPMAQSLKRGRTKLIGLVVADVSNPFSVAVLHGVEARWARPSDKNALVAALAGDLLKAVNAQH